MVLLTDSAEQTSAQVLLAAGQLPSLLQHLAAAQVSCSLGCLPPGTKGMPCITACVTGQGAVTRCTAFADLFQEAQR